MSPDPICEAMEYARFLGSRDEYIAAHAHHSWLLRGCPEGSPGNDWFQARAEFDQEVLAQVQLGIPA
jgi:hypothetical protein